MVINTNIPAQATAYHMNVSQVRLSKSLARLSSGSKIVEPADDAAGLAVSSRFDSMIKRLDAVLTNTTNARSFAQTQDGFLQNVEKAFRRMNELSVLALDNTKSGNDRRLYNAEFGELKEYISNTARQDFNGISLFSGKTMDVTKDDDGSTFEMTGIKLDAGAYENATNSGKESWTLNQDAWKTSGPGFLTTEPLWKLANGNYSKTNPGGGAAAVAAGTFLKEAPILEGNNVVTATAPPLSFDVNASGGSTEHSQTFEVGNNSGKVKLTHTAYSEPDSFKIYYDGAQIWTSQSTPPLVVSGTTYPPEYIQGTNVYAEKSFGPGTSTQIKIVVNEGNHPKHPGGTAWTYSVEIEGGRNDHLDSGTTHGLSDGMAVKVSWPGVDPSATPTLSKDTVYYVNAINATTFSLHSTQADAGADTNRIRISTADSGAITISEYTSLTGVEEGTYVSSDIVASGEDTGATKANSGSIVSTNQDLGVTGLNVGTKNSDDYKNVNLKTENAATIALGLMQSAINQLASDRAILGAALSRLDFNKDQLSVKKENLSEAVSRIKDADFAEESTRYAQYQILVNTGAEMLKKANQLPESALELLS